MDNFLGMGELRPGEAGGQIPQEAGPDLQCLPQPGFYF